MHTVCMYLTIKIRILKFTFLLSIRQISCIKKSDNCERARVAKDLHAMSTYDWRKTKANELMIFGDVEPSNSYNETVLRKVKQMDIDKKILVKYLILLHRF